MLLNLGPLGKQRLGNRRHELASCRAKRLPNYMYSAGASSVADPLRVIPVSASLDMMHSMLAVSHAATPDQLLSMNVAGFVLITDVDIVQRTITYLAPCPGSLPGRYLIAGSFKVFLE